MDGAEAIYGRGSRIQEPLQIWAAYRSFLGKRAQKMAEEQPENVIPPPKDPRKVSISLFVSNLFLYFCQEAEENEETAVYSSDERTVCCVAASSSASEKKWSDCKEYEDKYYQELAARKTGDSIL
jgi:hypothetical protein